MDAVEALSREVSAGEEAQIIKEVETYGYSCVKGYLTASTVRALLARVKEGYERINRGAKMRYAGVPSRDKDDKILYSVYNLDRMFLDILVTRTVRAIAMNKLNDVHYRFLPPEVPNYILLYYNARSSGAKLDLHIDSHIPFSGSRTIMMQFVCLLEDADEANGCTVVVPGSHRSAEYTDRGLDKVYPLAGKAGDLICWDSRLWHGTCANASNRLRWALIATLGMWWIKPSMDIVRSVSEEIYRGCSNEQKQLLGFCSIPPASPLERVNTKCGYEFLRPSIKDYGFPQ